MLYPVSFYVLMRDKGLVCNFTGFHEALYSYKLDVFSFSFHSFFCIFKGFVLLMFTTYSIP